MNKYSKPTIGAVMAERTGYLKSQLNQSNSVASDVAEILVIASELQRLNSRVHRIATQKAWSTLTHEQQKLFVDKALAVEV